MPVIQSQMSDAILKGAISLIQGKSFDKNLDESELLLLLKKNGYPLLALKHFPSSRIFFQAMEEELRILEIQREEYQGVQERFWKEEIHAILFKAGGIIPSFPYTSGNLDVLVQDGKLDEARYILKVLGFIELKNIEEPKKYLYKRFSSGEQRLALHLHGQIGWGVPFITMEGDEGRKAPDDLDILIPSPETGCLVTFAHSLYENKAVRLLDLMQVHNFAKEGLDWDRMRERASRKGWRDGFDFCLTLYRSLEESLLGEGMIPIINVVNTIGKNEISMPFPLSFLKSKRFYYQKIWKDEEREWKTKIKDTLKTLLWGVEWKMKIRSQPPMLIAFSGVDGSGKTTHSNRLLMAFDACGIRTKYVWSRYGSSFIASLLIKIGKIIFKMIHNGGGTSREQSEMQRIYLRKGWTKSLWFFTVFFELTIQYLFKVRLPLLFGRVVICDRYLLDALVELGVSMNLPNLEKSFLGKLLLRFNPKPSMGILMDLSPEAAKERGGTLELEQLSLYRRMAGHLCYTRKDAEKPLNDQSDEILYKTLSFYYKEFWTIQRGLFFTNPNQLNPKKEKKGKPRILVFTNMYPYDRDSTYGIFIKEQVDALRRIGVPLDLLFLNGRRSRWNYLLGILDFFAKIHRGSYTLIHAHHTYCAFIAKFQRKIPVVFTLHEGEIGKKIGFSERIIRYGFWKIPVFSLTLKRWIAHRVEKVITVFPQGGEYLCREDILVIPCGIDLELFKPIPQIEARKKLGFPLDEKILLFPAHPQKPEKRYDLAVRAFEIARREIPNLRLVHLGMTPHPLLPLYMNSADLMILTSDYEASPMVVKEAMAVNLPILSLDVGDVAEILQDTKGCFISPPNPIDLASKIGEVLNNGIHRTEGRRRVLDLDNEKIAEKIQGVYEELAYP